VSTKILAISAGAASDAGMVRVGNEDAYLVAPPLYVVADGMGGHRAGEVAARLAVTTLATRAPAIGSADASMLVEAMHEANGIILRSSQEDERLLGMATTCTAALVRGRVARIAHVGDSRAYLFHAGRLTQLTDDHSVVAQLVREGYLTPDEAAIHPRRNVIMRALGSIEDVEIDTAEAVLEAGDRLLLCSDGLTNCLNDAAILALLADGRDAQSTAERLVKRANAAGGPDNITVVVIDVRAMSS
jgi:protein phosphatase